jgi:membrane protein
MQIVKTRKAAEPVHVSGTSGQNQTATSAPKTGLANRLFKTCRDTVLEFIDDDGPVIAGAVAYSALQGVISLILGFIAIASFLLQDEATRLNFIYGVSAAIPSELNNASILNLNDIVNTFTKNAGTVSIISVLALLWSGSGVFGQLKYAINKAFDVQKDQRNLVIQLGMQIVLLLVMMGLVILAFGISLVASLVLNAKIYIFGLSPYNFSFLLPVISFLMPPLLEGTIFTILYRFTPAREGLRFKPVLIAAAVAVLLFELLKILFGLYLNLFGITSSTARTFGAIGGIFIFLFFLYLTSAIILFGAELAAVLHNFKSGLGAVKTKDAVVETKAEEIGGELVPERAAQALKKGETVDNPDALNPHPAEVSASAKASSAVNEQVVRYETLPNGRLTTIVAGIVLVVATVLNFLRRPKSRV